MIKASKKAIYAILSSADVTDEELLSAVVGAGGLINSRPLTYQWVNPRNPLPLTPNHFLHGQLGGLFAPDTVDSTAFTPRRRWMRVQELVRHFWHRWLREWLPSLLARKKWFREQENFEEGDAVIVMTIGAHHQSATWTRWTSSSGGRTSWEECHGKTSSEALSSRAL